MTRVIMIGALGIGLLCAQTVKPTFEAASVKPVPAGARGGGRMGGPGTPDPGRFSRQTSLRVLVAIAYRVDSDQVIGPAWMTTDLYSVDAVVPRGTPQDDVWVMLQNLLSERFHLTLHHETKEADGYDLVVGKSGPKIKAAAPSAAFPQSTGAFGPDGATLTYTGVPMSYFASDLNRRLSQASPGIGTISRVVDKTGLTEKYSFTLHYVGPRDDSPGPDLFGAIESQLGLRLEPKKMSVDTVVVDHADRVPVEN